MFNSMLIKGPNFKKYLGKNILCIDYGTKITGLAQFCPGREPFPYPAGSIKYVSDQSLAAEIVNFVQNEAIEILVLGIPYLLDGQKSDMTMRVELFAKTLQNNLNNSTTIYLQDETLSSFEAKKRMQNSPQYNFKSDAKHIDEVAATIILESFLQEG